MKYLIATLILVLGISFASDLRAKEVETAVPEEYKEWLDDLKKEMIKLGISKDTIKKAYAKNYYHYKPEVIELDRKQPEFVLTTTDYINRIVSEKRVKNGRDNYQKLYPLFKDMEDEYGVPINVLIAFWGAETNYGENFGHFEVIDALTTLSHDDRRSAFFKKELYEALKIIDTYGIEPQDMEGSWAGAMGHFQFMPSTFNNYAVDYNGDGIIDIWHSFEDAIASAANYLAKLGWKKGEIWGIEVSFGDKFEFEDTGLGKTLTIKEWKSKDVKDADGKEIKLDDKISGSVIITEGRKGKAYLVFQNFRKIYAWNRSENYALAIGKLSDYISGGAKWKEEEKNPAVELKTEDILKVQKFINQIGVANIEEDGKFGNKTKEGVKALQKKVMMPQDGYPDYQLLNKINRYNPDVGFVVPIQPKKVHK
ncbi:MAG: lytic murein transglycosylase [Lactobacillaceae bacterium]|jgi:membrane-bound lytic murein transglycosylase B|nr:lytic murein transglycosylase [Lactobacillaceae bacterium]